MRGFTAGRAVFQPAFAGVVAHQAVLGGIAKNIVEVELVRLPVAGEVGAQPLLQQSAALLQHEFELLDTGRPVDVIKHVTGFALLQSFPGDSERTDATVQVVDVYVNADLWKLFISACERIKQAHAGMLKITPITRNNGQIMDDGNRGNQSIL